MRPLIYLDHSATTPMRPAVREAMRPYEDVRFGNPSSSHRWGREAWGALEEARERLAALLGAQRSEIVFTSGGTESDNLAVLGRWRAHGGPVVCSAIEHKAVLTSAKRAGSEGAGVVLLAVDGNGVVDLGAVEEALEAEPSVMAVMWGNNEVGAVQPVQAIAERCRERGVVLHTDAVQAFGRVRIRADEVPFDLLAVSGHKIGAPKGVGALFVREGVELDPLCHGGGQEGALRPGTENVAAAVGLATAAELVVAEREEEAARLTALRDRLAAALAELVPGLVVNAGDAPERLPHILNVTIPGVDRGVLLAALDMEGVAVSGGSACSSGTGTPSHVLVAMGRAGTEGGLDDGAAVPGLGEPEAAIRMSLGHSTTAADIDRAIDCLARVTERLGQYA